MVIIIGQDSSQPRGYAVHQAMVLHQRLNQMRHQPIALSQFLHQIRYQVGSLTQRFAGGSSGDCVEQAQSDS